MFHVPLWHFSSPPHPSRLSSAQAGVIRQHNQHAVCIHLPYFIDLSSFISLQGHVINTCPPTTLHTQGRTNSYTCNPDFGREHKWACHSGHRASASPIPGYPFLSVPLAVDNPSQDSLTRRAFPLPSVN